MLRPSRWKFAGAFLLLAGIGFLYPAAAKADLVRSGKARQKPDESQLSHELRHQLQLLPYYSVFDYIAFTLDGGKVTLTGHVLRPTLRADAEETVKSIEGVTIVSNSIEVLPRSATDDDLRRAVYRAIYEDSVLQRYATSDLPAIHIIVNAGSVALEGVVENENEKHLAALRAAGVPGVASVHNDLAIRTKSGPAN